MVSPKFRSESASHLDAVEVREHLRDHGLLEKSSKPLRRMPHKYPQSLVDQSVEFYSEHMGRMLDEIEAVLLE